jgi:hypothetical protein
MQSKDYRIQGRPFLSLSYFLPHCTPTQQFMTSGEVQRKERRSNQIPLSTLCTKQAHAGAKRAFKSDHDSELFFFNPE